MPRYLAAHHYGMGSLWWWITADSAEQVERELSEVWVEDDPDTLARALGATGVDEVDLSSEVLPAPLDSMREQRREQRRDPLFGALAARGTVHLRTPPVEGDEELGEWLVEIGGDGYRTRQVVLLPDGRALRTDDWPFNPPYDLHDPELARHEITAEEFEREWDRAVPDPDAL
ncbi:hypothetical protein [Actinosynnema pretiosum]|nr:hypothetical protein [Actinosynnema pretiosum]